MDLSHFNSSGNASFFNWKIANISVFNSQFNSQDYRMDSNRALTNKTAIQSIYKYYFYANKLTLKCLKVLDGSSSIHNQERAPDST